MPNVILAVDDSASMRQMVGHTLRSAGYEVLEAADGVEALEVARGKVVDVVITDVNMPNMDGISLVREVKKHPTYKFTPIIMLTTESGENRKQEGQAAGAKAWVVKPFQPQQMLAAVSKLIM
jgi:two-component system chemotaxis response regulator CheY